VSVVFSCILAAMQKYCQEAASRAAPQSGGLLLEDRF
jgi:hypothetical protein